MPKRIDRLTVEQEAAIPEHVARWIGWGRQCGEPDWDRWESGARRCYGFADIPWPGVVVRVPSPIVGAFAAPVAAYLLDDGAVRGAVDGAVRGAVPGGWHRYLGGQWWASWHAYTSFYRDICGLDLGALWDRDSAYADANSAGWWWPHRRFVMVADRPRTLHLEQTAPTGWGSHRLHNPAGPAITWADGWALWYWHGTRVPEWAITDPTVDRIAGEANVEIRRCAIEAMGWDRYITAAGLSLHSAADDPGNPGQRLELFNAPADLIGTPVRVLLCVNGSPERDGTRRRYGLTVPADMDDPVSAAAWTYDLDRDGYALLTRRT